MSLTETIKINDAAIKRHLDNPSVNRLKDSRYPLYLKFNTARTGGSWFFITRENKKPKWNKLGSYPQIPAKTLIAKLPEISLSMGLLDSVNVDHFVTCGDLLSWYLDRLHRDVTISGKRKIGVKSAINKHLTPSLGDLNIKQIEHRVIDERLIWKLQQSYSIAHTRQIFQVLKTAFKKAKRLKMLEVDPMAGLVFTDFITAKIKPKDGKLSRNQLSLLAEQISSTSQEYKPLILLMLGNGTRIGETRQAKWEHIDWNHKEWTIPSYLTKNSKPHTIPLTEHMINMLKQHKQNQQSKNYHGAYLFKGTLNQPISATKASNIIQTASQKTWTAHDLRKLARTCWTKLGTDYLIGELLLNHTLSKLDETYINTQATQLKRKALEQYQTHLIQQGITFNLITLH